MWIVVVVLVGTLTAVFFATVTPFKNARQPVAVELIAGVIALVGSVIWVPLIGWFIPGLFTHALVLAVLPISVMFWFGTMGIRAAFRKPKGARINSLKKDFAGFFMVAPIMLIAILLFHPNLMLQSLSRLEPQARSLIGTGLMLILGIGLFMLRLNFLRFYAFVEIAVGLGASFIVVRKWTPASPVMLEQITALAAALYIIVRGLDNYRKGKQDLQSPQGVTVPSLHSYNA